MSVSAATRSSVSTETSHMLHRGALAAPAARCRGSRSILSNSSAVVVGAGALVVFFAKPGPPSTPVLKSPATIFPTSSSANHFSFVSTRVETNTISTTVHCSAYFSFENPAAVAAVAATLPSTGAPIGVTSTVTRVTPPGGVIPLRDKKESVSLVWAFREAECGKCKYLPGAGENSVQGAAQPGGVHLIVKKETSVGVWAIREVECGDWERPLPGPRFWRVSHPPRVVNPGSTPRRLVRTCPRSRKSRCLPSCPSPSTPGSATRLARTKRKSQSVVMCISGIGIT